MCFNRRRIPKHLLLQASPLPRQRNQRKWKWILGAILVLLTLAIAEVSNAQPDASAGSLVFKQQNGFTPALHLGSDAQVTIKGMLARVVLRQTFRNTGKEWLEGVYVFPLPEGAAINRMVLEIGDRRIVANIREKQEAQRIYQQAKREGKRAALTVEERPNVFTQSLANIGPGQNVVIELHYHEVVHYRDETFSWRLPTTLTPRYTPGVINADQETRLQDGGWALPTDQLVDAIRITPFMYSPAAISEVVNPIAITISLDAGFPLAQIHGSYHDLRLYKRGSIHQITTAQARIPMDRDFELTWKTVMGDAPDAAFFSERINGDDYALLMVMPPQQDFQATRLAREVIFIIDTSGSMSGTSIKQAKESLLLALSRLRQQDRFNLIEFNSYHRALFAEPQAAHPQFLLQAQSFVQRLQADGGTEMAPALIEALRHPAPDGYLKQVIFMTDGSVGNEAALFELIHQQLAEARLFTVGIGSAPNTYFMTRAAEFGRGTFTFIGDQGEVAEKMQSLFARLETPVMTDIDIVWPAKILAEAWPARIPDLYQGEPLLVSVKVEGQIPAQSQLEIRGQQDGRDWSRSLDLANNPHSHLAGQAQTGIGAQWARQKIAALLDEKIRGRDETEVRAEVLQVALQHQLLSPYTSFVAVEESDNRQQREPLLQTSVANLLPQGQTVAPLMYPRTATSAWLNLIVGGGAFFVLLLLRLWSKVGAKAHG